MLAEAVHLEFEFEAELNYSLGFRAGVEWARQAMDAAIADAMCAAPDSAQAVVHRLVSAMNRSTELTERVLGRAA